MYQVQSEMDSFVHKFQNLCRAGKDATLSFSSTAGKVEAKLSVDLGMLPAFQRYPLNICLGLAKRLNKNISSHRYS